MLTTPEGWWLIVAGCGVGFLFALVALCVSVVSFPLILDRHVGVGDAMVTSLRAAARNPLPMAAWGLIVAALLVLGSLPFFLGLAVVIPLLGHATWHLYRKLCGTYRSHPALFWPRLPPTNPVAGHQGESILCAGDPDDPSFAFQSACGERDPVDTGSVGGCRTLWHRQF